MAERLPVQIHNSPVLFKKQTYSPGVQTSQLRIASGARLVFTLYIFSADPGASASVRVKTTYSQDMPPCEVLSFGSNQAGQHVKRILTDFHQFVDVELEITGGNVECILGMTCFDNALSTRIENAEISADLNHILQPNGTYDSVRVGDGEYELDVLPDGSIKVNIVDTSVVPEEVKGITNAITGVLKDVPTLLNTYTAPAGKKSYLQMIECSGGNIAKYWVEINGTTQRTRRTYFGGDLNTVFDYDAYSENGFELQPGDVVTVRVEHFRPTFTGEFESFIQALEIG